MKNNCEKQNLHGTRQKYSIFPIQAGKNEGYKIDGYGICHLK